jgi:glyoxylase I family protein
MKFSHVALNCQNIAVTQGFYQQHFGFSHARSFELGAGAQIVFLKNPEGIYLELFNSEGELSELSGDGSHSQRALRHIAFQVESVDALLETLGSAADITLGPLDFDGFIAGWRTVWLRDPDGNIVEVSQGFKDN